MYELKPAFFINSLKSTFLEQAYEKVEVNIITGILVLYLQVLKSGRESGGSEGKGAGA